MAKGKFVKPLSLEEELPPLPEFEPHVEEVPKPISKPNPTPHPIPTKKKKIESIEDITDSVEEDLHISDLARKENIALEPAPSQNPEPVPMKATDEHARKELDALHHRQTEYLDGLRRRLDHEMRERRTHLETQKHTLSVKESELNKWERALLKKEKFAVATSADSSAAKKLAKQLEDKEITLKYEHMRLVELKAQMAEKDRELKKLHHALDVRDKEFAEREEKVRVLEGMLLHTKADEEHESTQFFTEHEKKLKQKYEKKIKQLHLHEPEVPVQAVAAKDLRISGEDVAIEEIQQMIISTYQEIGRENIETARAKYMAIKNKYQQYVQEFSSNHQLYDEIIGLYQDITRFTA